MSVFSRRIVVVVLAVVAAAGASTVYAVGGLINGATMSELAVRIDLTTSAEAGDSAVAFDIGEVDAAVVDTMTAAVAASGGQVAKGRDGSVGMSSMTRNGARVHGPPDGYYIPIVFTSFPQSALGGIYNSAIADAVSRDGVALNEITATQMDAQVGDVLQLRPIGGGSVSARVAIIAPHETLGGSEIVTNTDLANRLNATTDTRILAYQIGSRDAFDAVAGPLATRPNTRLAHSWDPYNPDSVLSTARLHQKLGEAWYRPITETTMQMHPTWESKNLTDGRVLMNSTIEVSARCNRAVVADMKAAFADVVAAGLANEIDVTNTNTYGGCFNPRTSRISGYLSRHAYAIAIDMNTQENCQGCVPKMSCDVVRIFRHHGFSWHGNSRSPDGMHFEWVGEPVDQYVYPSRYCPNLVSGSNGQGVAGQPPGIEATLGSDVILFGSPVGVHDGTGHDGTD